MISKAFTIISRSEPNFHDIDGPCLWTSVRQKVRNRLPNIDPNVTAEVCSTFLLRSIRVRFETCWRKHDDDTPVYIQAIQGHRSIKTNCELPVLQTYDRVYKCNLSSKFPAAPQHNSVEGTDCWRNKQEGRQTSMLLLGRTIYEINLIRARDMGLQFYRTFSDAVVHFGDIPADCIARVVGHDQTILHERPLEAAHQSKQMSVHRVADCVTKTNNR